MAVITSGNSITFQAGSDYTYTLSNATAGPGQTQLYVYADQLGAGDNLTFDGSAETTTSIYLTAGAGVDVLKGGQANDHFVMHNHLTAADSIDGGTGYDWLYLIGDYSAGLTFAAATIKNIESLYFGAGNSYKITLNDANIAVGQQLQIYGKDLSLTASLSVNGSAETNGWFYFDSATSRNTLSGGAQADTFYIHNGVGHGGVGTLNGGAGDDLFVFDGDLTASNGINGGSGTDSVDLSGFGSTLTLVMTATTLTGIETLGLSGGYASITTNDATIAAGVRLTISSDTGLTLNGSAEKNGYFTVNGSEAADNIKTGAMNDVISTYGGNDTLDGGAGADIMSGGLGNDTFYVDNAGDKVIEANGQGMDTIISSVTFSLAGQYIENLTFTGVANLNATGNALANTITGNSGNNYIIGGDGSDTLNGGSGADVLVGGLGNDTFYVDNAGDRAVELTNQGTDIVYSTVTFSLGGQYIENLTLTGTGSINATGNGLNNTLVGNSGNNVLNGGAGADIMSGGLGNDTYYVDNAGDKVTELTNQGTDRVISSLSFNLGDFIENLTLTGTANINGMGNALNNILVGNSGNNVLNGGLGVDTMSGGLGNDIYYVTNTGDKVVELAGQGTDSVFSSVSFSLGGQYIENLTLLGTAHLNATGNALANTLVGNSGNNTLDGNLGNDILTGGTGADIFLFGAGSGKDTITDFSAAQNDSLNLHAYTQANAVLTQVGGDTVIDLGGGNTITVLNTLKTDVSNHIVW